GHLQVLAQHRRHLDVEVVERGDRVDPVLSSDRVHRLFDLHVGGTACDRMNLVDRVTRPRGGGKRIDRQQQNGAAETAALAQERLALEIRGDAEDGHILNARLKARAPSGTWLALLRGRGSRSFGDAARAPSGTRLALLRGRGSRSFGARLALLRGTARAPSRHGSRSFGARLALLRMRAGTAPY